MPSFVPQDLSLRCWAYLAGEPGRRRSNENGLVGSMGECEGNPHDGVAEQARRSQRSGSA